MKRKSIRIMISLFLVLSLSFGVLAVDPNAMTDISGHWARDDIRYCLEQGLFTGTSATRNPLVSAITIASGSG